LEELYKQVNDIDLRSGLGSSFFIHSWSNSKEEQIMTKSPFFVIYPRNIYMSYGDGVKSVHPWLTFWWICSRRWSWK
jgi:hypothetical protein